MNIETNPVETPEVTTTDDLDSFEAEFFGSGKAPVEQPVEETTEEVEAEENNDNPVEVEDTTEEVNEEDEAEDDGTPPKQETRAEKRIRELNAKYREEERKRIELEERIAKLEKPTTETQPDNKTQPETNSDSPKAPHWDDEDENGNKKYPLGQFDPNFNADLVRFTVQEEQRQFEARQRENEQRIRLEQAEKAAQEQWEEKLAPALERYPDYVDKGQELIDQFSDLEPAYGKYLTDTIRSIDNGPEVFYHLASNPELAKAIVARGPAAATVELGRLSALLDDGKEEKQETPTRTNVTKAPAPPPTVRGRAAPKVKNLDDLDDFESVFFTKKR